MKILTAEEAEDCMRRANLFMSTHWDQIKGDTGVPAKTVMIVHRHLMNNCSAKHWQAMFAALDDYRTDWRNG